MKSVYNDSVYGLTTDALGGNSWKSWSTFQIMGLAIGLTYALLFFITIIVCSLPRCIKKEKPEPCTDIVNVDVRKPRKEEEMVPLKTLKSNHHNNVEDVTTITTNHA